MNTMLSLIGFALGASLLTDCADHKPATVPALTRTDFTVASDPGLTLTVRRIVLVANPTDRPVLLLIHGGGPGAVGSFDLNVPGGSLAGSLAEQGYRVYLMDVRGWGGSTDPSTPERDTSVVNVTYQDVARDIDVVVNQIRMRENVQRVALLGWASGGHWAGYYTTQHNDKVSHLVSLNSLYGVNAPWGQRTSFADTLNPSHYNRRSGNWRLVTADAFLTNWDRTIPVADKSQWRDPAIAQAYIETGIRADIAGQQRTPPSMRVPSGFREEAFYMSLGRTYWNARDIRVPALIIRTTRDFWSRPEDLTAIRADLINSPGARIVTIPEGTHYVLLERGDKGRDQLIHEVIGFIR